ncbi:hypothetical protein [Arthrobacter sp. AQ5-05]|uniref:hypothetical protein n=1 Tax=Arthrobacter sp. AQ5-05 TaxID=2184581 RepID=UPI0011BE5909|nr:hypothetical protein [Arthrobacter sp. AQ5-05]
MAGPVMLPDGRMVPSAYASAAPTTYLFGRGIYPVPPTGGPVTASVVVQGDTARARLNWYDAQKAYLGSTTSTTAGTAGGLTVSRVTGIPPAGAVGVGVGAFTALLCTAPTLVWGDSPAPWTTGRGCLEAVPHAPSSDLVLTGPGRTYSNLSFTVTELG